MPPASSQPQPPGPVWLGWPLGVRVTIRRRLPDAAYADWVGVLEQAEPNFVAVRHRSGELRRFEADEIVIAHRIVDRPRGRRRPTR